MTDDDRHEEPAGERDDDRDDRPTTPGGERLEGWKEIANHLRRGVRTAQRWEREHGLPVRRLRSGENVYAYTAELDEWRRAHERTAREASPASELDPADQPLPVTVRGPGPAPRVSRALWWIAAALFVGVLAGAAGLALWYRNGSRSQPASYEVRHDTLFVYDAGNRLLWQHTVPTPLVHAAYQAPSMSGNVGRLVHIVDLDHDGDREVLFATFREGQKDSRVRCFDASGRQRWERTVGRPVRFGGRTYGPEFQVTGILLTGNADGTRSIWVRAIHTNTPSVVEKLSAGGRLLGEFWSGGHVTVMREATVQGRRSILVGAVNNERFAASVSVVDVTRPSGCTPSESPRYAFDECQGGPPAAFLIFPALDVARELRRHPAVTAIDVFDDKALLVWVSQIDPSLTGSIGGQAIYRLTPALDLQRAELDDAFQTARRILTLKGILPPQGGADPAAGLLPVRKWTPSGFVPLQPGPR